MITKVSNTMPSLGKLAIASSSTHISGSSSSSNGVIHNANTNPKTNNTYLKQLEEGGGGEELYLAHVGDLLEHSWHYDCVVSPKYHHKHTIYNNNPLPFITKPNGTHSIKMYGSPHHHDHDHDHDSDYNHQSHAILHESSSSSSTLPSHYGDGDIVSKPLAHIIQYPSLSHDDDHHSCGYISLSSFIKSSSS